MLQRKRILFYLTFILTTVFVFSLSISNIKASVGLFYVSGQHYNTQVYGSSGTQVTHSVTVIQETGGGCASFATFWLDSYNWTGIGFYQGWNFENGQFYNYPRYYYDYKWNDSYHFHDLGIAPLNQNHSYSVHLIPQQPYPDKGIMVLSIDSSSKAYLYNYNYAGGVALGESESHNSQNTMDYHFWNMKYASSTGYWYPFQATVFYRNLPYQINVKSVTEWYAYGGGQ